MVRPQPSLPYQYYLGKLAGFALGFFVDICTMPWAGLALGHIVDAAHYNLLAGSDQSYRVPIPRLFVVIAIATACAYLVFLLYPSNVAAGAPRFVLDRLADAVATVVPGVDSVGRAALSIAGTEAARTYRAAVAASWAAAAVLMILFFVGGTFPSQEYLCERLNDLYQTRLKVLGFSSMSTGIIAFLIGFIGYRENFYFMSHNGLIYMANTSHNSPVFSAISVPSTLFPIAVFLIACSITLLKKHRAANKDLT